MKLLIFNKSQNYVNDLKNYISSFFHRFPTFNMKKI